MRQLHDINGSKRGLGFAPATRLATVLAGLAATIGFATPALGQSMPVGTFTIRVNGGPVHSVQSFANSAGANGTVHFSGSSVDPSGAWEASWEYVADLDPNGNAKLTGNATVNNKSSESAEYDVTFEAPICPFIQSSSKMGGACTIKIITSANGGAVSTPGGNAVFAALADGAMGPKLFHGPFNMGSTGSGTAETANLFGAPFPNMATAAVSEAFGLRHMFKLTDGDIVIITSNLVLGGDVANFVACSNQQMAEAMPAAPAGAPADQSAMMVQGEPAAPPMPPVAAERQSRSPTARLQSSRPAATALRNPAPGAEHRPAWWCSAAPAVNAWCSTVSRRRKPSARRCRQRRVPPRRRRSRIRAVPAPLLAPGPWATGTVDGRTPLTG